jgi:hypothetical protein
MSGAEKKPFNQRGHRGSQGNNHGGFPRAPRCTPVSSVVKIFDVRCRSGKVRVLFARRLCHFSSGQFIGQSIGAVNVAQRFDDAARIDMHGP